MKLEIDSERVKQAAESCGTAKTALKILFPEVFEKKIRGDFDITKLIRTPGNYSYTLFTEEQARAAGFRDNSFMQSRSGGQYDGVGFFLHSDYQWQLAYDTSSGTPCYVLIPRKKT